MRAGERRYCDIGCGLGAVAPLPQRQALTPGPSPEGGEGRQSSTAQRLPQQSQFVGRLRLLIANLVQLLPKLRNLLPKRC